MKLCIRTKQLQTAFDLFILCNFVNQKKKKRRAGFVLSGAFQIRDFPTN